MKRSYTIVYLCMLVLLASCEKNISLDLHDSPQQLVVEGTIERGIPPVIILTHSLNYFSTLDSGQLASSFVHDADITVSDGTLDAHLKEYTIDTVNGLKAYFYSIDTTDLAHALVGIPGVSYALRIRSGGEEYEATTTIPAHGITLDSLFWDSVASKKPEDSDKVYVIARLTDPPEAGDCARYFTKRNSEPYYASYTSVADDQVVNGHTFEINLDRGVDKNEDLDLDEYGYFLKGDTVTVKFCNIDKATYDFWRTWEYAYSSNGNPFSSPIKILGNIPGALGYWGGYNTQYKTIVIPKN